MSLLDKYTITELKSAGGANKSICTLELYYEIYMKFQFYINTQTYKKTEAYTWTADDCCCEDSTVKRAVKLFTTLEHKNSAKI